MTTRARQSPATSQSAGDTLDSARGLLQRMGALTTGLVLCFWILVALRSIPVPAVDYGMFVTVAERLKAGDRLYADVYENKDPFFHYTLALGRAVTPYAGWLLEVLWLLTGSIAGVSIARQAGIAFRTAVVLGFISVPAMMTGFSYWAGVSHVPGVALTLVSLAMALRHWSLTSGAVAGLLLFFKLVMFPIGVLFVAVPFIVTRQWRRLIGAASTASIVVLTGTALMLARGEFLPYLAALRDNAVYAGSMETSTGFAAGLEHVLKVLVPNNLLVLLVSIALVVIAVVMRRSVLRPSVDVPGSSLLWSSIGALGLALAALSQTGLWIHHAQILIPGASVALVLFMARGPMYCRSESAAAILTAVVLAIPLSGVPSPRAYITPVEYARAIIWEQTQLPAATVSILRASQPTTFARIGGGNDAGFGRGLDDWDLACRLFGQSTLTTPSLLEETIDCLPTANVVYIDQDAVGGGTESPWDTFIREVNSLMAREYSCSFEESGRICVRHEKAID